MHISAQYLEGGSGSPIAAAEARSHLREAFERVPLRMVLLGWDQDQRVVEACAEECALHGCDLYLWQPLLTGHGAFAVEPDWRVVSLRGEPVPGVEGKPEFTFICPNQRDARESILKHLDAALAGGCYQGVFLDRIRLPSPARDFAGHFGCFCDACRDAASRAGLDLFALREATLRLLQTATGRRAAVSALLSAAPPENATTDLLRRMLQFRQQNITGFVRDIAQWSRSMQMKVGLDCFSPVLARMVGQDISALSECSDWIKVMSYARAFGPATLPYELTGLARWLMSSGDETEQSALEFIEQASGYPLPRSVQALRAGGLSVSIITDEIQRARTVTSRALLAGAELVEMPGVCELTPAQIRADADALHAGGPDGVVLCWDLLRIPLERLELAGSLYSHSAAA